MMKDAFEEKIEAFDDRYEVIGEISLTLRGGSTVDIERIIFAWKLFNPDEDLTMKELVVVVAGQDDEILKIVSSVNATETRAAKGKKAKMAWALLRLKKEVMRDIIESAASERTYKVPFFLVGAKRTSVIFDMSNYELVSWEG